MKEAVTKVIDTFTKEGEELSWCPSWSNSLWQGWGCGLVHCPGENATDPIWRVLAFSDGISSWTPLKPQHSNPNHILWPINYGVLTSLLLPHLSLSLTDSLPSLNLLCHSKTDARFVQDGWKAVWSIPYVSVAFFPSLKQNVIAYRSSSRPECIFEIHQPWQSGFSRVYSNLYCSCSFEPEIIKIGQSSHKIYNNNSEFSRVYDNSKCLCNKSLETYWRHHVYIQVTETDTSELG